VIALILTWLLAILALSTKPAVAQSQNNSLPYAPATVIATVAPPVGESELVAGSGTIEGIIIQQSENGGTFSGGTVELEIYAEFTLVETRETQANKDGRFVFDRISVDPSFLYGVSTIYKDVRYSSILRFDTEAASDSSLEVMLSVYETTEDPSAIVINRMTWVVVYDHDPELLRIRQLLTLGNIGDRTVVGSQRQGPDVPVTLAVPLPKEARDVELGFGVLGSDYRLVHNTIYTLYDTRPVRPGEDTHQVFVSYSLPMSGTSSQIEVPLPYPVENVQLLVADLLNLQVSVSAEGGQLVDYGQQDIQGSLYRQWTGVEFAPQPIILQLSNLLDADAQDSRIPMVAEQPASTPIPLTFQGEIAYILDGNLWLHNLVSDKARQLTSDGDNMEPNWSPDGRYLVYSRGADLESADLYMLDVVGDGEAKLLVEQACCGAWSPDGERIAYVDLSGEEPALRTVHLDGLEEETLLDPLTYGRGAYPMGKLDWVNDQFMLVPLEVIDSDSLTVYRDVLVVNWLSPISERTYTLSQYLQLLDMQNAQIEEARLIREVVLTSGESERLAGYELMYEGLFTTRHTDRTDIGARITVFDSASGETLGSVEPKRNIYDVPGKVTNEAGLFTSPLGDVYVLLNGWEDRGATVTLTVFVDPLSLGAWSDCNDLVGDALTAPGRTDGSLWVLAIAYERSVGCSIGDVSHGIVLKHFGIENWAEEREEVFPWLVAPSLSTDAVFLAAERYVENNDSAEADLWGVIAVNTITGDEVAVAEGASQPAWRPDPTGFRFVQPDEQMITLEPPLLYDGRLYRVSYLTTGSFQRRDAGFFHLASPSFFADQEIRGLVVTQDGKAVTDPDLLRQVFERYHAAYHLYVEPPPDLLPLLGEELDTVLGNPLLMAMSPAQFLTSARHQNAAALRAMVSVWNGEDEALSILDDVVADTNQDAGTALEALGAIIEDQYQTNKALTALHADLKVAYESSQETVAWGSASLKLLRLMGELLVLSKHQQERAGWLQTYVDTFPNGVGGLNRDQLRATATVLTEAEDDYQQRLNLVVDFAKLEGTKAFVQGGTRLSQQTAADLIAQLAAKYGASLSSQAVAGLLSTVSVGLTVNSMLYGTDDLVANFQLARRSEDLRTTFRAAATDVQTQASHRAGANADAYDGDLAERYRIALLLETLAAVSAYHAYADGVAASQRIPNLLTLINSLRGEDWQAAAEGLHRSADNAERAVLNDLNNPAMLDAAVTLALTRMRPQSTTDGEMLVEPITGMAFVFVPAGEFVMGSTEEQVDTALEWCNKSYGNCNQAGFEREIPQRAVYVDDYWIGQTEVTNAQFQYFVDAGGYTTERYWSDEGWQARVANNWTGPRCLDDDNFNAPDQPVVCVSWYEADAYTRWMSETTRETYRLPTEAEWEKAARGTDGRTLPWGDNFDGALLNFCDVKCQYGWKDSDYDDGYEYAAPVGSYPAGASPYGALDMAGNVWEWVNDWYQDDYYSISPGSNPQGPATGDYRVLRGGSWDLSGYFVRSAFRYVVRPDLGGNNVGFRCVRSAKSVDEKPAHDETGVLPQDISEKLTSYTLTEQPGDDFLCFGPCPKLCRFGCDSVQVTHVKLLNITTADQANGIEQKWCAEVQLIAKDEGNTWVDKRIYYEIAQSRGQLNIVEGSVWIPDMGITPACR